ncbi:hypothetical protein R1sor_006067 [Riccia sorocarpa]|uniref:Uncharacterized protein n=1 Tax=Riccia sorocarpa TaxID=122646 RepID=A0ABD3HND4_9MARC
MGKEFESGGGGPERQFAKHFVNSGLFGAGMEDDELRDRSMKDQRLYLISRQEKRVPISVLTAIELSDRLEDFVACMMKMRATLKTSLAFLLEIKAYPVNSSTHNVEVVVRFCKTKVSLDRAGRRYSNGVFMSAAEERSYWINFLGRDLEASASLLQVAKDLKIRSLIEVILLIHEPTPGTVFRFPTVDLSFEERTTLLKSSSLSSSSSSGWVKAPSACLESHRKEMKNSHGTHRRSNSHCFLGILNFSDFGSLLVPKFPCEEDPEDLPVGNWGLPVESSEGTGGSSCHDSNSTKSQESVLSLAELMRLESVVENVGGADHLNDVISKLSMKFDAITVSEFGELHDQTSRSQVPSKSWNYTTFSNRSPDISTEDASSCNINSKCAFQISPEVDYTASAANRVERVSPVTNTQEILRVDEPSLKHAKNAEEVPHYVSLGIRESKKQKLMNVLKATAKMVDFRKTINPRSFWLFENSKRKSASISALPTTE